VKKRKKQVEFSDVLCCLDKLIGSKRTAPFKRVFRLKTVETTVYPLKAQLLQQLSENMRLIATVT